jgi:hypothetical protein
MIELIVIGFLLVFIAYREYVVRQDMQKLVDKIISRDLTEYASCQVDIETAKKKPKKEADLNTMYRV